MLKAVITTLDNLPLLQEQVMILKDEVDEIIVVNNGSQDGTKKWLAGQDVTAINRENLGAGPGRNAGIDAAEPFDYVFLLDGGIRPLVGGIAQLRSFLERNSTVDAIAMALESFTTDIDEAFVRWPRAKTVYSGIGDDTQGVIRTYHNSVLSLTAYCLAKHSAFDGIRFCEEGPFAQPGWGVDDNELAGQWKEKGIILHAIEDMKVYRRAGGSFNRLFKETGIWPTQYGSNYEERVVWMQQNRPEMGVGCVPIPLAVIIWFENKKQTIELIKAAHEERCSVIVWNPDEAFKEWTEPRRLRQNHGDVIIIGKDIVRRDETNEDEWVGDFRLCEGDWHKALHPSMRLHGVVKTLDDLERLIAVSKETGELAF